MNTMAPPNTSVNTPRVQAAPIPVPVLPPASRAPPSGIFVESLNGYVKPAHPNVVEATPPPQTSRIRKYLCSPTGLAELRPHVSVIRKTHLRFPRFVEERSADPRAVEAIKAIIGRSSHLWNAYVRVAVGPLKGVLIDEALDEYIDLNDLWTPSRTAVSGAAASLEGRLAIVDAPPLSYIRGVSTVLQRLLVHMTLEEANCFFRRLRDAKGTEEVMFRDLMWWLREVGLRKAWQMERYGLLGDELGEVGKLGERGGREHHEQPEYIATQRGWAERR